MVAQSVGRSVEPPMPGATEPSPKVDEAPVIGSVRFERLLLVPRALVGFAVIAIVVLMPEVWAPGLVITGLYFLAVTLLARHLLAARPGDRGPFLWTSIADGVGCTAVLVLFMPVPEAPGVLLYPLLTCALALKYCVRGAAVGIALLTLGIGVRAADRSVSLDLPPRVWLILLILAVTAVLLGLAGMLRANERGRMQAIEDRRRLACLLRDTVTTVLDEAHLTTTRSRRDDLLTLVERACTRPELAGEVTRRLATAVSTRADKGPLSARETQVLRLLAAGRTDREIAAELFLSRGTVRVHVSNISRKLGASTRDEAVAWYHSQPADTRDELS